MKKICIVGLLMFASPLHCYATIMNHREVTSNPLLFKQDDYSCFDDKTLSFEIVPWGSGTFDPAHTMANLGINGTDTMVLNQQGGGDINPELILLGSANVDRDYLSTVTLQPKMYMFGGLFHLYKQFKIFFLDLKTSLINCRTQIVIDEVGGGNGGMTQLDGTIITNALQAFSQADWSYGKFGTVQNKVGLDNVQFMFGASKEMESFSSACWHNYGAAFMLLELPTAKGSQAEWLFEPMVGTKHCGLGFGADFMSVTDSQWSFVGGGNYRYLFAANEVRSFDLAPNGAWSRYLGLQEIAQIGSGPVNPLPGINLFTQDTHVDGTSQITMYARLQKRWEHCLVEVSYNFFHTQAETVSLVNETISDQFGVYYVTDFGGVTTASNATIAQANPAFDLAPVTLVATDLNVATGAAGAWTSNMVAGRFQYQFDKISCGLGGSVEMAHSVQALSSWSVWLNLEVLV